MTMLNEQHHNAYWKGLKNLSIRWYFYVSKGMGILNEFRNLGFLIIGGYYALKLNNPWLLVAMFIPSVIILLIVGWFTVHHMSKVIEFLNTRFATHYSLYQFTLLEEIRDELKKANSEDKCKS